MSYEVEARPGHSPLRVTARLVEPVVTADLLIHLDGALAYAAYREMSHRARQGLPPLASPWAVDLGLPLARWRCPGEGCEPGHERLLDREGRVWGWCASNAVLPAVQFGRTEMRKRVPTEAMARYAGDRTVQPGMGPLKAYDLVLRTVLVTEAVWYAVGDGDRVRDLLSRHVPAIGKKRGTGNGTVAEWTVEEIPEDEGAAIERDGRATRVMPVSAGLEGAPGRLAVRPPYHHASRRCAAVRPAPPCPS